MQFLAVATIVCTDICLKNTEQNKNVQKEEKICDFGIARKMGGTRSAIGPQAKKDWSSTLPLPLRASSSAFSQNSWALRKSEVMLT